LAGHVFSWLQTVTSFLTAGLLGNGTGSITDKVNTICDDWGLISIRNRESEPELILISAAFNLSPISERRLFSCEAIFSGSGAKSTLIFESPVKSPTCPKANGAWEREIIKPLVKANNLRNCPPD
jgi:hypothetical protein